MEDYILEHSRESNLESKRKSPKVFDLQAQIKNLNEQNTNIVLSADLTEYMVKSSNKLKTEY